MMDRPSSRFFWIISGNRFILKIMAEEKSIPLEDLIGNPDQEPEPGYDEWFRAKVEKTLAAKKRGEMKYYTLEEIEQKFC